MAKPHNWMDREIAARRAARVERPASERLPVGWQWGCDPEFEPYETQKKLMDAVLVDKCSRVAFWGAPGNGKTYIYILVALSLCVLYPGYVCVIVRKNVTDIRKTLIKPANDHLSFVSKKYGLGIKRIPSPELGWKFPNGSVIFVASGENDQHVQGGSYDAVFFEELAQIGKSVFNMAIRQNRGAHTIQRKSTYPPLLAVNCNPAPGSWVHLQYAKPFFEGKKVPNDFRVFVAKTRENTRMLARLKEAGIDYVQDILDAYGNDYGELLLNGSWDIVEGLVYGPMTKSAAIPLRDRIAITPEEFRDVFGRVQPDDTVFIGFDHGQNDPTAAILGVIRDKTFVVFAEFYEPLELKNERYCVECIDRLMLPAVERKVIWDPNMKPVTKGERTEVVQPRREFAKLGFIGQGGGNTKNRRYRVTALRRAIAAGRFKVVADWCPNLFREWNSNQKAGEGFADPDLADPEAKDNHAMDAVEMVVAHVSPKLDLQAAPQLFGELPEPKAEAVDSPPPVVKRSSPLADPEEDDDDILPVVRRGLINRPGRRSVA